MLSLKVQAFHCRHQQAEQLHLGFDRCNTEQLHTALQILFNALPTFISRSGLKHRSRRPETQRPGP